ncbi:MAG: hypothetical protein AB7G17_14675 [Phycisphaerales bacterium]
MAYEIVQLNEIAEDGEVLDRMPSWYCEGHVDRIEFIRTLVDHCVDYGDTIPSIDPDSVKHQFLYKVGGHDGSWTADFRDKIPAGSRKGSWEPVTTFEVARRFGGVACAAMGCTQPVAARVPVRAVLDAKDGGQLALYFSVCIAHRALIPDPQYRVCLVPVGAIVVMPASEDR